MIVYRVTVKATGEEAHFRKISKLSAAYRRYIAAQTLYNKLRTATHHENEWLLIEKLAVN